MDKRSSFRASSLPRLAHCPASAVSSEGCTDDSVHAGVVGTAFHAVMAYAAEHGLDAAFERVKVEAIARGVDPDEVSSILTGFKWDPSTVNGQAEVKLELVNFEEKLAIRGTADLLVTHSDVHIEVIDYKTTRRYAEEPDPQQHPQVLAYGLAAWKQKWGDNAPPEARCTVTLAFARLGSEHGWASFDFWESDLAWIEDTLWTVARNAALQYPRDEDKRDFQTGAWCQYCPARRKCKALTTDLEGAMNLVNGNIADVNRENVLGLFALRKTMTRFESALKKRVRELIEEGGPIETGESVLEFRSSFRKPSVSLEDVLDALRRCGADRMTSDAVEATLSMREKIESKRLDLYKQRVGE